MKRALLVSGGIDPKWNDTRYRNDLRAFYRLLRTHCGFGKEDIRVCLADGGSHDFEGDQQLRQHDGATRPEVESALAWLGALGAGDLMLLVASNHGGPQGLWLWGAGAFLSPVELEVALAASEADKVLVFGQCCAGLFAGMRLGRAVICCACGATESSWARTEPRGATPQYDEFLFHFAGALAQRNPDGTELSGVLPKPSTVADAFEYARRADACRETPLMVDHAGLAARLVL